MLLLMWVVVQDNLSCSILKTACEHSAKMTTGDGFYEDRSEIYHVIYGVFYVISFGCAQVAENDLARVHPPESCPRMWL